MMNKHVNETVSLCFASLAILRKLCNMAPFDLWKQLVETLILSKIDYCDLVFYPLPAKQLKRLQQVQSAAACFGPWKFLKDAVLKLGWLPMLERWNLHLLKTAFQASNDGQSPEYKKLKLYKPEKPGLNYLQFWGLGKISKLFLQKLKHSFLIRQGIKYKQQ